MHQDPEEPLDLTLAIMEFIYSATEEYIMCYEEYLKHTVESALQKDIKTAITEQAHASYNRIRFEAISEMLQKFNSVLIEHGVSAPNMEKIQKASKGPDNAELNTLKKILKQYKFYKDQRENKNKKKDIDKDKDQEGGK